MGRGGRSSAQFGFTIVEMLVVVGVIGVLVGLVIPTLASFRADARSTECLSNLRQLFVAVDTSRQQRSDVLPFAAPLPVPAPQISPVPGLPERLKAIIKPEYPVWLCPSDESDDAKLLGTSYSYVPGAFMLLEPPIVILDQNELEADAAREARVARLITQRYTAGYLRKLPILVDNGEYHAHGNRDPHNAVFIDGNARPIGSGADNQISPPEE